jgi:hypothetical protein
MTVPDGTDPDATDYMNLVEKATVLLFRAAGADPSDPSSLRDLGRLGEIRALFARDSWERRELMDEAQVQFARAARLEYERAYDSRAASAAHVPPAQHLSGREAHPAPLISELAFAGRLRRGEATLDELIGRYQSDALPAERNPRFWADRLFIVQAGDDASARAALYDEADAQFREMWKAMPVEVPWRGQARQGPAKVRKIEVLEAWASAVLAMSTSEQDRELRSRLFYESVKLMELGLPLPLDTYETEGLLACLDRAEPEAPDADASAALWSVKDTLFGRWLDSAGRPPEANARWGDDLYARAGRQPDARLFAHYVAEGDDRYGAYIDEVRMAAGTTAEKAVTDAAGAWAEAEKAGAAAEKAAGTSQAGSAAARPAGAGAKAAPPRHATAQEPARPAAAEAAARLEEAETVARALFSHGESLDLKSAGSSEFPASLSQEELDSRRRTMLVDAASAYQEALDLSPGSIRYMRALSRASLRLSALARSEDGFLPRFEQALSLALSAASREPDSGGAFFAWGRSLMEVSESVPFPAARERMTAEALAAFRQNLRSHSPFVPELNEMADLVYRAAQQAPGQRAQAYRLLTEICRRLAALRPDDPDARFALSLAMLLSFAADSPRGSQATSQGTVTAPAGGTAGPGNGAGNGQGRNGAAAAGNALNGAATAGNALNGAAAAGNALNGAAAAGNGQDRNGTAAAGNGQNRNGAAAARNGQNESVGPMNGQNSAGAAASRNSGARNGSADGRGLASGNSLTPDEGYPGPVAGTRQAGSASQVTGGQGGPGAAPVPPPPPGAYEHGAPAGSGPDGMSLPAPWNSPGDTVDRRDFRELLNAAGEGLEILSMGEEPSANTGSSLPRDPLEPYRRDPARIRFLEPEGFLRVNLASATRAERNASALNSFVGRLADLAPQHSVGPWHMLQLASFLRRSAATGYLPPEEEKAYFRLALKILSEADALLRTAGDSELAGFVLAEQGLALAESTLGGGKGAEDALASASRLWDAADAARAGSSAYARARWAAWSGGRAELGTHLAHSASDEDVMLWPKFSEALQEPAFRPFAAESWFKALWFGYGRAGAADGSGDNAGDGGRAEARTPK